MRYRSFGKTGQIVSAVSLLLDGRSRSSAREWRDMVRLALDCGINGFEIAGDAPAVIEGASEGLSEVERELLFVTWRPSVFAADPANTVEAFVARTGLEYLDLLAFDGPPPMSPSLEGLKRTRRVRAYGLAGQDDESDLLLARGAFDALAAPYSPISGWKERNRIKAAAARDMAVVAHSICPDEILPKPEGLLKKSVFRDRANPLAGVGGYRFLENTPGWTAEELCLAYVLTEPSVTTVRMEIDSRERLERLADVAEKDLPTGVAAQIEMARFSVTSA
ncbi:MAG: aldo/keto reductase [Caulobacter sp.]|jgi:aryl-alcohol dehydrogenase-like predicted oxidoreductase|nr:aldo/keto reductase [Caulobacter sp.]